MTKRTVPIFPAAHLRGTLTVPGDKSISHRAAVLAALARGTTTIRGFLIAEDCRSTLGALRALGVRVTVRGRTVVVHGAGLDGLRPPQRAIDCGNSGTTMRLLMGLLAGQPWTTTLQGDASLSRRPMRRVAAPLERMGARVTSAAPGQSSATLHAPLAVHGRRPLRAIRYRLPVASAQVKSAVLLAGLYAPGRTQIREPMPTRNHTERMLRQFGVAVHFHGRTISLLTTHHSLVSPGHITVPGDISSAAFFLVAAALVSGARVTVRNVGLNPTRTGVLDALRRMGAQIKVVHRDGPSTALGTPSPGGLGRAAGEPYGDVTISHGPLRALAVAPREVPRLIDELPILMVAACYARGVSRFRGVEELRVKESDRIAAMTEGLRRMGADVQVRGRDTVVIRGSTRLHGADINSYGDHRIAMSLAIAALAAAGATTIRGAACVSISFPEFWSLLARLRTTRRGKTV